MGLNPNVKDRLNKILKHFGSTRLIDSAEIEEDIAFCIGAIALTLVKELKIAIGTTKSKNNGSIPGYERQKTLDRINELVNEIGKSKASKVLKEKDAEISDTKTLPQLKRTMAILIGVKQGEIKVTENESDQQGSDDAEIETPF